MAPQCILYSAADTRPAATQVARHCIVAVLAARVIVGRPLVEDDSAKVTGVTHALALIWYPIKFHDMICQMFSIITTLGAPIPIKPSALFPSVPAVPSTPQSRTAATHHAAFQYPATAAPSRAAHTRRTAQAPPLNLTCGAFRPH